MRSFRLFTLFAMGLLAARLAPAAEEAANGPDYIELAKADNPKPAEWPSLRIGKEKIWNQYFIMLSARFPNVPDFQCDAWCYESQVDFVDARAIEDGKLEFRHRDKNNPQALVITTASPEPGAVLLEARMALDSEGHAGAELPAQPAPLNLCWQLRHAPSFASAPDPYPDFVKRCFIFTATGRSFLLGVPRSKIPCQPADHPYNNPPWVQMYMAAGQPIPETGPTSWAGYSYSQYTVSVIGAVSRGGDYLAAIANDSALSMSQAWHDCMHNNPEWTPPDKPVAERRWKLRIYAMENRPEALLERVKRDFPLSWLGKK